MSEKNPKPRSGSTSGRALDLATLPKSVRESLARRFRGKYDDNGECWLWRGDGDDYASFGVPNGNGRRWLILAAHRVAYALFVQAIPAGAVVMHTCDNPRCVNPAHLRLATQSDNMSDAAAKRRMFHPRGELHHNATLTDADVDWIRKQPRTRGSVKAIAERFGIHRSTVRRLRDGLSRARQS